jgi:uncharacterized protein
MVVYYFDTSAIIKRYRTEIGTDVVDEILKNPLSQDRFYTSFLTILEVTSGITRLVRGQQLTESIAGEIFSRFRQDIQDHFRILPLDNETVNRAVSVVEKFGLRSADAIHMATAIYVFSAIPESSHVMVSSDRELLESARSANLTALDPQNNTSMDMLRELRTGRLK